MEWPIHFKDQLIVGDPKNPIGICTLWTLKDLIIRGIAPRKFSVCGQLYSREGIKYIVKNILANPKIYFLIICGEDRSGSGETLIKAFKKNEWLGLEKEIPLNVLEILKKNVKIIDLRGEIKSREIHKTISVLSASVEKKAWRRPEIFLEKSPQKESLFPSDLSVFKARYPSVALAWPWVLKYVMKFGVEKRTEHGVKQKEIMNLAAVIYDENSQYPEIPEYFAFTREEFEKYASQILDPQQPPRGIEYTYGTRLRNYLGIDQIYDGIIAELKKFPESRRAIACIWYTPIDYKSQQPPCINLVQGLVQNNHFYMTVYIRSNDMFNAWPQNVLALRRLQELIAKEIKMPAADLTTISASAHIYEQDFGKARAIIQKHAVFSRCEWDPRGNFVIGLDRQLGEIVLSHYSPDGIKIDEHRGKNSRELRNIIDKNLLLSQIGHAFYLGKELYKAEMALKSGKNYIQDN